MGDNAIKIVIKTVRMIYVWGLELVLVIACLWDSGRGAGWWRPCCWSVAILPGSLLSCGHWGSQSSYCQPPSRQRDHWFTGQVSFAGPGVGRHLFLWGWKTVSPRGLILWIENLNSFSDTCKLCFSSYTYVGGKERCVRKKPELSTVCTLNLRKMDEICLVVSYFCLRLTSQTRPGLGEVCFLLPVSPVVLPSVAFAITADQPCVLGVLLLRTH